LLDYVLYVLVLANLDHEVAVISIFKHFPEVDRDAKNLVALIETDSIVVCLKPIVPLDCALIVQALSDWLILDLARIRTTFLYKGTPLDDPIGTDYVVGKSTFYFLDRFTVFKSLVKRQFVIDSLS
jgi:hypothetical protein